MRRYFGNAGHFCAADSCRFHLTTLVNGTHIVSMVGEYVQPGDEKKDAPERYTTIGHQRLYETMVFTTAGETCPCGCELPTPDSWSEIDFAGYNSAKDATEGHDAMCAKYGTVNAPLEAAGVN
jgi:hypothetical protein